MARLVRLQQSNGSTFVMRGKDLLRIETPEGVVRDVQAFKAATSEGKAFTVVARSATLPMIRKWCAHENVMLIKPTMLSEDYAANVTNRPAELNMSVEALVKLVAQGQIEWPGWLLGEMPPAENDL